MFDLNDVNDASHLEALRDFPKRTGVGRIAYVLAMRTEEGLFLHSRTGQPCYGELRKYYETHGDEYTDPEPHDEYRPSDLHWPFPDGKPEGISVCFGDSNILWKFDENELRENYPLVDEILEYVFSKESPWVRGIVPDKVEFIRGKRTHRCSLPEYKMTGDYKYFGKVFVELDQILGIVMTDLSVDPTVMVNLFNNVTHCFMSYSSILLYKSLRQAGASMKEAIAILMTINPDSAVFGDIEPSNFVGYYNPIDLDWTRFTSGESRDLTGGLLSDRYDYNRKRLHEIFETTLYDYNASRDDDDDDYKEGTFEKYCKARNKLGLGSTTLEGSHFLRIFREAFGIEQNTQEEAA